jgi:hypothetical protein
VLTWVLQAISVSLLRDWLAFKGGTAIKKIYLPDYRYSEDLDFTLLDAHHTNADLRAAIEELFPWLVREANITLATRKMEEHAGGNPTIYLNYIGPLQADIANRFLKVDFSRDETLVFPTQRKPVRSSYSDCQTQKSELVVYSLEEILSEKLRSLLTRTEPRAKQGKPVPEHEDWRDMKVRCWYQAEPVPTRQRSERQRQKAERDGTVFRTTEHRYFCDICHVDQFGKLVWASGCHAKADLVPELVFVCDGTIWIWDLVSHYYPNTKQIVDWFHAEEHLEKLAEAALAAQPERQTWLASVTEALWHGQVEDVVLACQTLKAKYPHIQPTSTYFANNAERMRYDQFRKQGYLIGSGTIESGCKQIVTQRLKRSGAQWTLDGAVQTAKARAAWLSGEWTSLCAKRASLPLAI